MDLAEGGLHWHVFAGFPARVSLARKDALYEALNREDWDWRGLHRQVALQALRQIKSPAMSKAFVLDDSIKTRSGKKMPGVSSHFDHRTGRHVMGQQVLTLGLSSEEGFVPLDSELFVSATKAQALHQSFKEARSRVAKRYQVAKKQSKPMMAASMMRRALRAGVAARYLLADAWFGSKPMIRLSEELLLTPILRMKKGAMKYRLSEFKSGKNVARELDVKAIYQHCVRRQWQTIPGQPYHAKAVDVEINLSVDDEPKRWVKARLLFVRGAVEQEKAQVGKHDWAVFLTTDLSLTPQRILALYALRWAIEVYFQLPWLYPADAA